MHRVTETPDSQFSSVDLDQILESTFVERVEYHPAIDSTNQRAIELAEDSAIDGPLLVLAESQTNGRGRGKNRWWSQRGALTFTLLLDSGLEQRSLPQASLTAGLAVCEAIEAMMEGTDVKLKWPNDVYCQQRKLCGILIELPKKNTRLLAIGIGINVNNSLQCAPESLRATATSLCDIAGHPFSLSTVLVNVLNRLAHRLSCVGRRDEELRTRWRERCLLTSRTVEIDLGNRVVSGLCRGIDNQGALVVETAGGTEVCFAGSITSFSNE